MEITNLINERQQFLKYLLMQHQIENKNTVWILNLLKDREDILSKIKFMRHDAMSNRLIIFNDFKIHLVLPHGIVTDAFVIFHYLLSLKHTLYLVYLPHNQKYMQIEMKEQLDLFVHSVDVNQIQDIERNLYIIQRNKIVKQHINNYIDNLIEVTLLNKDKERFNQLMNFKQMLGE
ncbi:YpiB family protein [Macrococcus armenti]|uniref:YpiB family protein n=1 Tax=Macrococcus armenti TaxID=2875764 RepID=UPI001CD01C70|nr:YpiB family protein [Macrococcus armenti]UBH23476.1 YpiB family protein [Macrococcus armenti]